LGCGSFGASKSSNVKQQLVDHARVRFTLEIVLAITVTLRGQRRPLKLDFVGNDEAGENLAGFLSLLDELLPHRWSRTLGDSS
jgi:hypothetical protein